MVCGSLLQCVAVCCTDVRDDDFCHMYAYLCVAVCYSVLQCVTVCCSVIQYDAMCSNEWQCVAICCTFVVAIFIFLQR